MSTLQFRMFSVILPNTRNINCTQILLCNCYLKFIAKLIFRVFRLIFFKSSGEIKFDWKPEPNRTLRLCSSPWDTIRLLIGRNKELCSLPYLLQQYSLVVACTVWCRLKQFRTILNALFFIPVANNRNKQTKIHVQLLLQRSFCQHYAFVICWRSWRLRVQILTYYSDLKSVL